MNLDAKILNKMNYDQAKFSLGRVVQHMKINQYTILIKEAEKATDKIQHAFMIKTLIKIKRECNFLNLIKGIYEKPTSIMLSDKK